MTIDHAALRAEIRPMPRSKWQADYGFNGIERALAGFAEDYGLNLEPDFQRGHVWTPTQERFVETIVHGTLASSGLVIQFNCPHWERDDYAGDLPREMQCVDGLQRLTAVRRFMAGQIRAFGRTVEAFDGAEFSMKRTLYTLKFAVHTFQSRGAACWPPRRARTTA